MNVRLKVSRKLRCVHFLASRYVSGHSNQNDEESQGEGGSLCQSDCAPRPGATLDTGDGHACWSLGGLELGMGNLTLPCLCPACASHCDSIGPVHACLKVDLLPAQLREGLFPFQAAFLFLDCVLPPTRQTSLPDLTHMTASVGWRMVLHQRWLAWSCNFCVAYLHIWVSHLIHAGRGYSLCQAVQGAMFDWRRDGAWQDCARCPFEAVQCCTALLTGVYL